MPLQRNLTSRDVKDQLVGENLNPMLASHIYSLSEKADEGMDGGLSRSSRRWRTITVKMRVNKENPNERERERECMKNVVVWK